MIQLSILIPSTPDRSKMLNKLVTELRSQRAFLALHHPTLGSVEILVDDSKGFLYGGLSIGKKRQKLVEQAQGNYLCFCDSDDWVSPNYVESILRLAQRNADVISFRNISKLESYWMVVDMSIHYPNDGANPNFMIRRKSWHICPVRTEFAKLYEFEDSNYGEDFTWMEKVLRHCTTEAKSEQILHEYRHGKHSEADKIIQHELQSKQ